MAVNNPYANPPEEKEQMVLAQWLDVHGIKWFHVPNEGKHKVQYRVKQKKLGVKPGVPDVIIVDSPPKYKELKGTAIELKRRKGGRVTPQQTQWLEALKNEGWAVAVCKGAGEAISFLESLGYGSGQNVC